jgi:hypothetical protein
LPGVKQPGHELNNSSLSSAEVIPPVSLHGTDRENFAVTFYFYALQKTN